MQPLRRSMVLLAGVLILDSSISVGSENWETVPSIGKPQARHEAAFVGFQGKMYLIGGRRINPIDVFDPSNNRWTAKSATPLELHHFQAVVLGDRIYLMGAMTGPYPKEKPLEKVVAYHPQTDNFEMLHTIPANRRRGGAGAVVYREKIYLVGGITNGHIDGFQPWLDEYDPKTGSWRTLPDAPHARDHFQAVVIGDRLYASAGRTTSQATKEVFNLTVETVDIFDFKAMKWLPPEECPKIPTPRAGNMAIAVDGKLVVGGGESMRQRTAHNEVEVYDPTAKTWTKWPALNRGRHGSGFVRFGNHLYTASGCGNRGGNPELDSIERLLLPPPVAKTTTRESPRSRLFILADMGNEPDEEQQMVHMITCSNEFDLEGLVAVTGKFLRPESKLKFKQQLHPELFHQIIDAYKKVLPNLEKHAEGWPSPDYLRSIVASGQRGYGIEDTGLGKSTEGSKLIIDAVTKDDPRPLWLVVNAGSNTLAQALIDYRATHTPDEVDAFVAKLRVFENGAQDNAGAWICAEFPRIHWIRSNYQTYAYGGPSGDGGRDNKGSRKSLGPYVWKPYPYSGLGQHHWALDHIKAGHGELGVAWPLRQFHHGRISFVEGGGTIPWLGLVNKGLFSTEHVEWGGWAGRFEPERVENYWSKHETVRVHEQKGKPFRMFAEAEDQWINPDTGEDMSGIFAPVWRFRQATWNDFAVRMDWCNSSYEEANHHPIAAVGDNSSDTIIETPVKPGQQLNLDASASSDPDGDKLSYRWWYYPEAGTYRAKLPLIEDSQTANALITIPKDARGKTIHVILEVTDDGKAFPLTDYRRLVLKVN